MKKGQITIYAVLGIILIFSFFILFFLYSNSSNNSQIINLDVIESRDKAEELVSSCMYEGGINAIELLGKQGGYYYSNQEIVTPYGSFNLKGVINKTSEYVVEYNSNYYTLYYKRPLYKNYVSDTSNERVYFKPPQYPCRSKIVNSIIGIDTKRDMPECSELYTLETGIDSLSREIFPLSFCNREYPKGCVENCICKCEYTNCNKSIQSELEDYISKYFKLCLYKNKGYFEINSVEDPKIITIVDRGSLYFKLNDDLNFSIGDLTFQVKDVQSKRISLNLFALFTEEFNSFLNKEGYYPMFNFIKSLNEYTELNDFEISENDIQINEGSITRFFKLIRLNLKGVDGLVKGKDFNFFFLKENRIPILQYIPQIQIPGNTKMFNITFRAVDPDDDSFITKVDFENKEFDQLNIITKNEYTKIINFKSKLDLGDTGLIRISVCDLESCDFQVVKIKQN